MSSGSRRSSAKSSSRRAAVFSGRSAPNGSSIAAQAGVDGRFEDSKVFCARHRPISLAEADTLIAELADLVDEPPHVVKSRLCGLIPEYAGGSDSPPVSVQPRKAHAK